MARIAGRVAVMVVPWIVLLVPSAPGQTTRRVSVDSTGAQGDRYSVLPSLSADGRFVAFYSDDTNLVSGDTNASLDSFVRDCLNGTTEQVSVDSLGNEGNNNSTSVSISADGRFVAFASAASNLVAGDTNGEGDIFLRDRQLGTTVRVSVDSGGAESNDSSTSPAISADGRFVAFVSHASNLVAGDGNGVSDVFVHDLQTGTTERVSVDSTGAEGNDTSLAPAISADGRYVTFASFSTNLVAGDTNGTPDIFLRDRQAGTTERVSVDSTGTEADAGCYASAISADGRFVAFDGFASNLVAGDTNGTDDVFVRDRQAGTTERISVDSGGGEGNHDSFSPSISADGRFVAFVSGASNPVAGDTNGWTDTFVHDRSSGATRRVSVDSTGAEANYSSEAPSISADGRFVAFASGASNLVANDTNGWNDIFLRGPNLTLEADPLEPLPGATLTISTWTGAANGLTLLAITDLGGAPTFIPEVYGTFDAAGLWVLSATVPSGLSGIVATFRTFGIVPSGKVDASEPTTLSFQ